MVSEKQHLEEHKQMVILAFERLHDFKVDMAYEGSFPCPKIEPIEQVDHEHCDSFNEGNGCRYKGGCPSYLLNSRASKEATNQ